MGKSEGGDSMSEKKVRLVLRNDFFYRGVIINETDDEIVIMEKKIGRTTIKKDAIVVRTDYEGDWK